MHECLSQLFSNRYSWLLSTLVGAVYTFGFILMCPQLYLNYKLKSVAHLPWRQMTFKFLNTIIDDLFAFVIKMPTLHRIACFRDDVIFLIFLYQRWIYPVDKTRANEFGYSETPGEADTAANGPTAEGAANGSTAEGAAAASGACGVHAVLCSNTQRPRCCRAVQGAQKGAITLSSLLCVQFHLLFAQSVVRRP